MLGKVLAFAACVAVSYAGWRYYSDRRAPVRYETQRIERGDLDAHVTATGSCSALETVEVGAQVSGLVKAVYADYNTRVHKGQILALIDPGPFEVQLTEAEAALQNAKASVTAARAALNGAKTNVHVAQEQKAGQQELVGVARSAEGLAKLQFDRADRSNSAGIISPEDFQTAKTNLELADDDFDVSQKQLDSVNLSITELEAEVDQEEATLESELAQEVQAERVVELAKVNLSYTEIKSPIEGIVLNRNTNAGETVASSMAAPILFELVRNLDKMRVDVNLDESDVGQVKAGQPATFTVDAFPGRIFQASVREVRHAATNISNVISYDVVLDVIHPVVQLLPGMTANISIRTAERHNVVKVPNGALRFRPDGALTKLGTAVYTLGPDNHPTAHAVTPGISDGRFTELLSGDLQDRDFVIVAEVD